MGWAYSEARVEVSKGADHIADPWGTSFEMIAEAVV